MQHVPADCSRWPLTAAYWKSAVAHIIRPGARQAPMTVSDHRIWLRCRLLPDAGRLWRWGLQRMQQWQQVDWGGAHWLEPLQAPSAHRRSRP